MNENQIFKMNISSGAFADLREDFDKILKRTLHNMESKESDCAEITLKLKISLEKLQVPDFEFGSQSERTAVKPKFDHKVSSVMNIKDEESGSFKGDNELVWDETMQDFVLRPIDNGQINLFIERDGTGRIVYETGEYIEHDESCIQENDSSDGDMAYPEPEGEE